MAKTILVWEDDALLRNELVATLTGEKYDVLEADSSDEVRKLSRVWDAAVDLIIADSRCATMRASELWLALKEVRPNLRVLLTCGKSRGKIARRAGSDPWRGITDETLQPENPCR
jgi:DNA-binding NtrC family response regulator